MGFATRNLLLITAFLAGGLGVGGWLYAVRSVSPRRAPGASPPFVKTLVVHRQDITQTYIGYGTAKAESIARLSSEVASTVLERVNHVRDGVRVSAGQPLVRLDDRDYQYALDQAVALADADAASIDELNIEEEKLRQIVDTAEQEYRVATAEFERVSGLFERAAAAEKEMNDATLARQRARRVLEGYERELALVAPQRARMEASHRGRLAAVERARLDVGRCLIVAPIDGVIQRLEVDVGDRVAPGSPVATILDARRVEIPIQLPGSLYGAVTAGVSCRLESECSSDTAWTGTVARVAPMVDEQTRTFTAFLSVDNGLQPVPLIPGVFVRALIEGATQRDVLAVPRGAIRDGYVFVEQDGLSRRRAVVVDRNVVERAIVHGALGDGDRVILSNLDALTDGTPVRVAGGTHDNDTDGSDARVGLGAAGIKTPGAETVAVPDGSPVP